MSGTITSKSTVLSTEVVDLKDGDGNSYACMLEKPDEHFRDFRQGDHIFAHGRKRYDEKIITSCQIVMWTSTGGSHEDVLRAETPGNGILVSVPHIVIPTGMVLRSEDVQRAWFWEAGADLGLGGAGEPQDKADDDTLRIQMKDPQTKFTDIKGPHALRIADELDKSGVTVSRRHKK